MARRRRKPIGPVGLPESMNFGSMTPEQAREFGTAMGLGGVGGAAAWADRKHVAAGITPFTWRGLFHGVLWCLAFTAIFVVGRLAIPAFGAGWIIVAIIAMIPISKWWSRRFGVRRHAEPDSGDRT